MSDSGAPSCLVVAGRFFEGVIESYLTGSVGGDGEGFHEISDRDLGAVYGNIDGGGGGAVGGTFVEMRIFEGVDHNLEATLAVVSATK